MVNNLPRIQFLLSNNSTEIAGDDVYGRWNQDRLILCKFSYTVLNLILRMEKK